ncbi:MAG TPA: alpha/beta hydrolase-fold protein [Gaiellales bacterium]|nr:alpha/beta hydrolase-fold protein [Gaiellales bacterium]
MAARHARGCAAGARGAARARFVGACGVRRVAPARLPRGGARATRRRRGTRLRGRRRELLARPPGRRGPDGHARGGVPAAPPARVRPRRARPAIAGWSMGGYGALLAAERDPAGWSGVAVASPAIWPAYSDVWVGDAFDGRGDFEGHDVFAGSPALERMPVWIGCGRSDPFSENSRRLAARLRAQRTNWADGGHDQCLWRLVAPTQMAFAAAALQG